MHKNSLHNKTYDFEKLIANYEPLKIHTYVNAYDTQTIDFSNPQAVKALNSALLFTYYDVNFWEFPNENLCPPIPSRADYLHHLADLLKESHLENDLRILDVGTGATCIYPLLGHSLYKWRFVGSDIDETSLKVAQKNIDRNGLGNKITLRRQKDSQHILEGILNPTDKFDASVCNPPFFKSQADALEAANTKWKGLGKSAERNVRNFGGTPKELCYPGGEKAFLHTYLYESSQHKQQCFWFSSLVSQVHLVRTMETSLKKLGATEIRVLNMAHGNKVSRIVAWTFLTPAERNDWTKN